MYKSNNLLQNITVNLVMAASPPAVNHPREYNTRQLDYFCDVQIFSYWYFCTILIFVRSVRQIKYSREK